MEGLETGSLSLVAGTDKSLRGFTSHSVMSFKSKAIRKFIAPSAHVLILTSENIKEY